MHIDPFYPILPDANWIARLVPLGIRIVQLRIKNLSEEQTKAQILASKAVCDRHGCHLIVNDFWRLARDSGSAGVHLGQEDLSEADLDAIKAAGLMLGISTHDKIELDKALAANPDYVALGPVFGTHSKVIDWAAQGLENVARWREQVPADLPLIAIGGITVERATEVLHAGASSIAVIGDILNAADPESQTRRWLSQTEALRA
ncbi:MAG: thiamine phosphate synthase [Burkholderiaceae bacterium]